MAQTGATPHVPYSKSLPTAASTTSQPSAPLPRLHRRRRHRPRRPAAPTPCICVVSSIDKLQVSVSGRVAQARHCPTTPTNPQHTLHTLRNLLAARRRRQNKWRLRYLMWQRRRRHVPNFHPCHMSTVMTSTKMMTSTVTPTVRPPRARRSSTISILHLQKRHRRRKQDLQGQTSTDRACTRTSGERLAFCKTSTACTPCSMHRLPIM